MRMGLKTTGLILAVIFFLALSSTSSASAYWCHKSRVYIYTGMKIYITGEKYSNNGIANWQAKGLTVGIPKGGINVGWVVFLEKDETRGYSRSETLCSAANGSVCHLNKCLISPPPFLPSPAGRFFISFFFASSLWRPPELFLSHVFLVEIPFCKKLVPHEESERRMKMR